MDRFRWMSTSRSWRRSTIAFTRLKRELNKLIQTLRNGTKTISLKWLNSFRLIKLSSRLRPLLKAFAGLLLSHTLSLSDKPTLSYPRWSNKSSARSCSIWWTILCRDLWTWDSSRSTGSFISSSTATQKCLIVLILYVTTTSWPCMPAYALPSKKRATAKTLSSEEFYAQPDSLLRSLLSTGHTCERHQLYLTWSVY